MPETFHFLSVLKPSWHILAEDELFLKDWIIQPFSWLHGCSYYNMVDRHFTRTLTLKQLQIQSWKSGFLGLSLDPLEKEVQINL